MAATAVAAAAQQQCALLLCHHGDALYSLRHAGSGHSLYVDELGAPCMDARSRLAHPDERLMFWLEPGWATLQQQQQQQQQEQRGPPATDDGNASSSSNGSGSGDGLESAGFVAPVPGAGLTVAGFSLRSLLRVGGQHLYLSVLPDGFVTTVHATGRPTRWELFTLADLQASALGLLLRWSMHPGGSSMP